MKTTGSQEIFKITKLLRRRSSIVRVCGLNNQETEEVFYRQKLSKIEIDESKIYKIGKVLEEQGRGNRRVFSVLEGVSSVL